MKMVGDLAKLIGYGLCRVMPIDQVSDFGARIGRYDHSTQIQLGDRVRTSVEKLGWSVNQDQLMDTLKRESGRAALEMLMADRIAKAKRIEWEPHPGFESLVAQQRSIVFVTIHLSNLGDLTGAAIVDKLPQYRMGFVTRKISPGVENWIATRCRNQTLGNRNGWVLSGTRNLARQMVDELGHPPACTLIHIDEARQHQVHVPLFGRPLPKQSNLNQAVRLAYLAGACLVPLIVIRKMAGKPTFKVRVLDVVDPLATQLNAEDTILQVNKLMEKVVTESPGQWLQLYHLRY